MSVLRTNIVDSGVGLDVFKIFQRQDEDRRVTFAASAVVCNLVADCSPLRSVSLFFFMNGFSFVGWNAEHDGKLIQVSLEQGVVARLVELIHSGEPGLRLNALWALKNLLYKSSSQIKRSVMHQVGWPELETYVSCIYLHHISFLRSS